MTAAFRAHLVQFDIAWEDKAANYGRVARLLEGADVREGDLVLLPEMFDTGFSVEVGRTADKDGASLEFLADLAADHGCYVQGGRTVHACGSEMASNTASVLGPGGRLVAEYQKIHPFSYGREAERFTGGDRVIVWEWERGGERLRVCPAICYDLRFPELFRLGLGQGAEAYALGACWPEARQHHWRSLLIARAIENQAFVLGVNRTGADPFLKYAGGSIAVGPKGEVLGELGAEEGVLTVELEPESVRGWRATFPAWRDVRLMPGARAGG